MMKLLACSVLLLAILGKSYCKTTSTINRTSTTWGYGYEVSDIQGLKLKHDDKGYHFEPIYNNTSSGIKKHYNSRTVYDHFTSPGATNDSQSHRSANDVNNGTSNGVNNSNNRPNKEPLTTGDTITVAKTQTDTPLAIYSTIPSASNIGGTPVTGQTNWVPNASPNGPLFSFPTVPLYNPLNGLMYGPPTGQNYGPPISPIYMSPTSPIFWPPTSPMYRPPTAPNYGPPTSSMYRPPTSPMYRPPTGPNYGPPTAPNYAPTNDFIYGVQNGQIFGPQQGQMYGPQNGQTSGYPTRSSYGSYHNY